MSTFHNIPDSPTSRFLTFLAVIAFGIAVWWRMSDFDRSVAITISLPPGARLLVDGAPVKVAEGGRGGTRPADGVGPLHVLNLSAETHQLVVVTAQEQRYSYDLDLSGANPLGYSSGTTAGSRNSDRKPARGALKWTPSAFDMPGLDRSGLQGAACRGGPP